MGTDTAVFATEKGCEKNPILLVALFIFMTEAIEKNVATLLRF